MEELLAFWEMLKKEFDIDLIEEYAEDAGTDLKKFSSRNLSNLSTEEIDEVFWELISLYMDVSGTDSLGDVYEILHEYVKDESRISRILKEDE